MKPLATIVLALLPVVAFSQNFDGTAELGYLSRSGNTDSTDLLAKLTGETSVGSWKYSGYASYETSEENNIDTAERVLAGIKAELALTENDYLFGTVDYENDEYGAYALRWTEAVGYGRRLINSDVQTLDAEIGVGARQSRLQDGTEQDETIVRLGAKYRYNFATGAFFTNNLIVEPGEENTYIQNEAAVDMPLLENVSLKVAYNVRHNTDVPAGTEKTDTTTSVNVAYRF